MRRGYILTIVGLLGISLPGCNVITQLLQKSQVQKPTVRFAEVKLADLSFQQADLLFDLEISNPNGIGINLAALDYDLQANSSPFLNGNQNENLEIKANDKAIFQLPLSLNYKNIFETFSNLRTADSIAYKLTTGLSFNLPVLGVVRIPVEKSGGIPSLSLPAVSLKAIKLDKLSLSGADLSVQIGVDNSNAWSVNLDKLDYNLMVNGAEWLQGISNKSLQIKSRQENIISLPVSFNFLQIGTSLYNLLSGGQNLQYTLNGKADMTSSIRELGTFNLPFSKSGTIDLIK